MNATTERIQVRRARTKSSKNSPAGPYYWIVRQPVEGGSFARVFTYKSYYWAQINASRLAHYRPIGTFGLRGFHIESGG